MWKPVYTASKFAVQAFLQLSRQQMSIHGIRLGAVFPEPVRTALVDNSPDDKLEEALANASVMDAAEVADAVFSMLMRPHNVVVRGLVILPNSVDLRASGLDRRRIQDFACAPCAAASLRAVQTVLDDPGLFIEHRVLLVADGVDIMGIGLDDLAGIPATDVTNGSSRPAAR